ncbi:unnamed protein product [Cochlearia groenlandica]
MLCCGGLCMMCTCLIPVMIAVGFLLGFGLFKHGFNKIHDSVHLESDPRFGRGGGIFGGRGYGFQDHSGSN